MHKGERRPACPKCRHPGYWRRVNPPTGRPEFVCDSCGHAWLNGADGGKYLGGEMGVRALLPEEDEDE